MNIIKYNFIIGFPWLEQVNLNIRLLKYAWYYQQEDKEKNKYDLFKYEFISSQTYASLVLNGNKIFIIYFQILPSKDYISLRDMIAKSISEVPYEYADYASIFSEKEASILALH